MYLERQLRAATRLQRCDASVTIKNCTSEEVREEIVFHKEDGKNHSDSHTYELLQKLRKYFKKHIQSQLLQKLLTVGILYIT